MDLHFHGSHELLHRLDAKAVLSRFNELGVATVANGSQGSDASALSLARRYGGRYLPFAGQGPLRGLLIEEGERAWNLESQEIRGYMEELEAGLRTGKFSGIGELFVNKFFASHGEGGGTLLKYPADSPLMQRL